VVIERSPDSFGNSKRFAVDLAIDGRARLRARDSIISIGREASSGRSFFQPWFSIGGTLSLAQRARSYASYSGRSIRLRIP